MVTNIIEEMLPKELTLISLVISPCRFTGVLVYIDGTSWTGLINYRLDHMKRLFACTYLIKHPFPKRRRSIFWSLLHRILGTGFFFPAHTARNLFIVTVSAFQGSRSHSR